MDNKHYTIILFIALVVVSTLYLFNECSEPPKPDREIHRETTFVEIKQPPIILEGETKTIVKKKYDTIKETDMKLVNDLIAIRDSLHKELSKFVKEDIVIDTVIQNDTINFWMDYYTLKYRLSLYKAPLTVPHIVETVTEYYDNRNDKWYAGTIGYLLGIVTVIAILLGV